MYQIGLEASATPTLLRQKGSAIYFFLYVFSFAHFLFQFRHLHTRTDVCMPMLDFPSSRKKMRAKEEGTYSFSTFLCVRRLRRRDQQEILPPERTNEASDVTPPPPPPPSRLLRSHRRWEEEEEEEEEEEVAYSQFPLSYSIKTSSSSLSSHYCLQTPPPSLPPTSRCSCSSSSSTRAGQGFPTILRILLNFPTCVCTLLWAHQHFFPLFSSCRRRGRRRRRRRQIRAALEKQLVGNPRRSFFPCSFLYCRRMCNILGNIGGRQGKNHSRSAAPKKVVV